MEPAGAPVAGPSRRGAAGGRLSFERVVGVFNAVIALGLAFHLGRELGSPREMASTDFTVFRTGWSLVLRGQAARLYDAAAQGAVQRELLGRVGSPGFQGGTMAFLHPPHAALAGCALGWLAARFGAPVAFWLWTLVGVALFAHLARLIRDELGGGPGATALVAVTLAAFYPVLDTLQQGQVSSLLAVAALACVVALHRRRALAAAAWLLALSIKPQTLPALLVVLVVRREWRALSFAALLGAVAVALTSLVLGAHVWADYLTHLPGLERLFGAGTPEYMPTVRGLLTRLLGAERRGLVDGLALAAWLAALAAAGLVAWRSRARADGRAALAFALAVGALASPHLFAQDLVLWAAPVTLVLSLARDAGDAHAAGDQEGDTWRVRSRVVLAWPLWFVLARALDVGGGSGPRLPFDLVLVPLGLATAWAAREATRAPSATTVAS